MLDLLLTNGVVRTFDVPGRAEAVGVADPGVAFPFARRVGCGAGALQRLAGRGDGPLVGLYSALTRSNPPSSSANAPTSPLSAGSSCTNADSGDGSVGVDVPFAGSAAAGHTCSHGRLRSGQLGVAGAGSFTILSAASSL